MEDHIREKLEKKLFNEVKNLDSIQREKCLEKIADYLLSLSGFTEENERKKSQRAERRYNKNGYERN